MIPCIGGPLDGRDVDEVEHSGTWLEVAGHQDTGRYERVGMEFLWRPGKPSVAARPLQPLDRRRWAVVQEATALPPINLPGVPLNKGEALWIRYPGTQPNTYRLTIVDSIDGAWCEFDVTPGVINLAMNPAGALRRALDDGLARSRAGG